MVVWGAIVAGLGRTALAVTDDNMPESMLVLIIALCVIAGLCPAAAIVDSGSPQHGFTVPASRIPNGVSDTSSTVT